ncbi:hypothetical protein BDA96_05G080200 [Sorghum bicolor]|uniref:Terpene synthase n=2 Tax=Sorghum bicolor TaxID=4558 RepID=C5Y793_SORBI|nr:alpha-humulene synthase [Sorghum bicolor]XP_021316718.1 alpha-humulene synthase [Sorghum bicolor]EES09506.1 hypothetical protein SORBI_3005G079300 [Sorghum bicolor]KAG0529230.1 hypothetical protein BDA96_05G080200 [Sorghum bicolor]|eukprot:XP_002450518.1 alpha-humulene synthase [Sorghum bicolor]
MGDLDPKRPSIRTLEESKWTRYFMQPSPLPCSSQPNQRIMDRRDELVWKVRCMIQGFIRNTEDLLLGMKTVDALQRLGLGYHFEEDISKFMHILSRTSMGGDDLFALALQFRLLRQHHYNVASEIFNNFMDENGDFKDALRSNVDGLLSLYEAAHLGKSDEDLLRKAIIFTKDCLSSLVNGGQLPKPVLQEVLHALDLPTQRRIKRLEAKLYISIYENGDESNQDIVELAKLNFHMLQQMHRDEVRTISLWWYNDLNPSSLGPYMRKRPVECYYWALGIFYEPQYAKARIVLTKLLTLLTMFDDIIDSYGTMEEVHLFNQAVQSWNEEAAKQIGDGYWYLIFHISKTLEEFVSKDGGSPMAIDCFKETLKAGSKAMVQELVWREEGQVPTVHEYLKQGAAVSILYWPIAVISFAGMFPSDDEIFTWAGSYPKIIESSTTLCRLMDDVAGHENEKEERSKCVTAVECYVREHGVTVQEAKQALTCLVDEQWRCINQELYKSDQAVPIALLDPVLDLVRVMEEVYKGVDMYTKCSGVVDPIHKLLNECVEH